MQNGERDKRHTIKYLSLKVVCIVINEVINKRLNIWVKKLFAFELKRKETCNERSESNSCWHSY
jgi:hypothetical protein